MRPSVWKAEILLSPVYWLNQPNNYLFVSLKSIKQYMYFSIDQTRRELHMHHSYGDAGLIKCTCSTALLGLFLSICLAVSRNTFISSISSRLKPSDQNAVPTHTTCRPAGRYFLAGSRWNPVTGPHRELSRELTRDDNRFGLREIGR